MSRSTKTYLWTGYFAMWVILLAASVFLSWGSGESAVAGGYLLLALSSPFGWVPFFGTVGLINIIGSLTGADILTPLLSEALLWFSVSIGLLQWVVLCRWSFRRKSPEERPSRIGV